MNNKRPRRTRQTIKFQTEYFLDKSHFFTIEKIHNDLGGLNTKEVRYVYFEKDDAGIVSIQEIYQATLKQIEKIVDAYHEMLIRVPVPTDEEI